MAIGTFLSSKLHIAGTLVAIVLATRLGSEFGFPPTGISTFWPPNGILFASLLMMNRSDRSGCLLFAIPTFIIAEVWVGFSLRSSFVFAVANCVEVAAALLIVIRFAKPPYNLGHLHQLVIMALAVTIASPIGGIIGATEVMASGGVFIQTFLRWSFADLVGHLVFVPLVLTLPAWREWFQSTHLATKFEAALAVVSLLAVALLAYGSSHELDGVMQGTLFLPIPVMLWLALRFGPKGSALASLIASMTALTYAINGVGPFSDLTPEQNVFSLQLFITSLVLVTIAVAVLLRERDLVLSDLAQAKKNLELRVEERGNALLESQGRYQTLVELAPICIHEIDLDGKLTSMNAAGLRMMGAEKEAEICGLDYLSIPEPDQQKKVAWLFSQALDGEPSEFEFSAQSDRGQIHFLSCFAPVRNRAGEVSRIVGVTQDITGRKKTEAALRQAQKMEAIGQLTGGVAHDFNNLLAVILGNTELLETEVAASKESKLNIEAIKNSVQRGASLTERLLAYARKTALKPVSADIVQIIGDIEDLLQRTLGGAIELKTRSVGEVRHARIDPHQFEDAVLNLAINARDAMLQGGVLTIEIANEAVGADDNGADESIQPGDYVKVTVSDTGEGIPPENLEQVTDPFFTTKEVGKGSGLGLSMVYGFARQSKGYLKIDSLVGRGTTVALYLPSSNEPLQDNAASEPAYTLPSSSQRILVVEDDPEVRRVCTTVLRKQGFEITEASTGIEAMQQLSNGDRIDLLFTDIVLPGGMDGVEIAKKAKDMHSELKVLYTTGFAEFSRIESSKIDPSAIRINKPYPQSELLEKIKVALET